MIGHLQRANGKLLVAAAIAAMLTLVGSFVLLHYAEQRRAAQSRLELCGALNQSRAALRDVLLLARDLPRPQGRPPPSAEDQRIEAEFYRRALARVSPVDCRKVGK